MRKSPYFEGDWLAGAIGFESLRSLQLLKRLAPSATTSYNDSLIVNGRHGPWCDNNVTEGGREDTKKPVLEIV